MHAIRQHTFGPADTLLFEEVEDPRPGPGQVRIAVEAAGVHLVDTVIRAGATHGPFAAAELPMTPGREVAGRVDVLGDGVEAGWLDTRVVAHLGMASGGYAELAVAPVEALHRLPDTLDATAAVAMMGTGRMTMGVLELARLRSDDVVLVTSAAGGIGTLVVQAARAVGATVVGAAGGPTKVALVRENGATVAVDYTVDGWADEVRTALDGRDVTVVLDGVGGEQGRAAFDLLGPGGRILLFGWSSGTEIRFTAEDLFARSLSATVALGPPILNLPGGLRTLEEKSLAEAAAGRLVPAVQAFPLKDAATAHQALEERSAAGKIVLLP